MNDRFNFTPPAGSLSPRRLQAVVRLAEFLHRFGAGKFYFDWRGYSRASKAIRLRPWQVMQAIDDAHAANVATSRLIGGALEVVQLGEAA